MEKREREEKNIKRASEKIAVEKERLFVRNSILVKRGYKAKTGVNSNRRNRYLFNMKEKETEDEEREKEKERERERKREREGKRKIEVGGSRERNLPWNCASARSTRCAEEIEKRQNKTKTQ